MEIGISLGLPRLGSSRGGGGSGPSLFSFEVRDETNSTTLTDWPSLRVSIDGGAWQTLAAAGLTVTGFDAATNEIIISGLSGTETSISVHNKQEQPGEPFSAAGSINDLYIRRTGDAGPANTHLPGLPINATRDGIPVEATL
jgi:hypothetical protein